MKLRKVILGKGFLNCLFLMTGMSLPAMAFEQGSDDYETCVSSLSDMYIYDSSIVRVPPEWCGHVLCEDAGATSHFEEGVIFGRFSKNQIEAICTAKGDNSGCLYEKFGFKTEYVTVGHWFFKHIKFVGFYRDFERFVYWPPAWHAGFPLIESINGRLKAAGLSSPGEVDRYSPVYWKMASDSVDEFINKCALVPTQ